MERDMRKEYKDGYYEGEFLDGKKHGKGNTPLKRNNRCSRQKYRK